MASRNRSDLLSPSSSFQPQPPAIADSSLAPDAHGEHLGVEPPASIQDTDAAPTQGSQFDSRTANPRRSFQSYSLPERGGSQRTGNPKISTSSIPRSGRGMAAILDIASSRTRRERTFIGAECAVCDEPLEHTLRGERVLQLSCGHVSHEACFYEYIKEFDSNQCPTCDAPLGLDTSRGGNVLDLGMFRYAHRHRTLR